jgi:mono/diheme cytochrome c family protein
MGGWKSVALVFCFAIAASGAMQTADNPELVKKGRELFGVTCVQCHGAGHITVQRKTAANWKKTVYTMISRGAPVLPGEADALVAYLTSAYGPASPPPALDNPAAAQQPLPAGSDLIVSSCGSCHAARFVFGSRKPESDWKATVMQMRSFGATITDAQEKEILAYLLKNNAPQ